MDAFGMVDADAPWYHGSPLALMELRVGSTITQVRDLARVFSHKPSLVFQNDDGAIRHNGIAAGYLYRVAEPVTPEDLTPVPGSTMGPGQEWLILRPVRLLLLERTAPDPAELLTAEEEANDRRRASDAG